MKAWRPYAPGMMIVEPRLGSGRTAGGLYVEIGLYTTDLTRRTKMVATVLSTYGTKGVKPDDTVIFRYGTEDTVRDSSGEEVTFLHERNVLAVR